MFVPQFTREQLLRTFEVLTKRRLGSERLFNNYIYMQIERQIYKFTGEQYCRLLRTLGNKGYQEDRVFWKDYIFDYVRVDEKGNSKGNFSKDDAVRERLKATFVQIEFAGPQEFAKRLEAEIALCGDIIQAAKIKMP